MRWLVSDGRSKFVERVGVLGTWTSLGASSVGAPVSMEVVVKGGCSTISWGESEAIVQEKENGSNCKLQLVKVVEL